MPQPIMTSILQLVEPSTMALTKTSLQLQDQGFPHQNYTLFRSCIQIMAAPRNLLGSYTVPSGTKLLSLTPAVSVGWTTPSSSSPTGGNPRQHVMNSGEVWVYGVFSIENVHWLSEKGANFLRRRYERRTTRVGQRVTIAAE
ncbi:hypothetical protein FA13DRAFT_1181806 [Coprinellus micaceus]|uniref:Uncharacterized protein n=1 Tax=Coprinellus micaceus TaxID=71717 RepID=A0A4Y7RD62_COPMI|nr:hypothetical protein FA13DRAFT_1181806 [Coprinellus micaceus]